MRSRTVRLPRSCCSWTRSAPPISRARSRRNAICSISGCHVASRGPLFCSVIVRSKRSTEYRAESALSSIQHQLLVGPTERSQDMTTSAISIEPLTPTIGATVHGVDLTQPIDEETFQFIHDAWMDHLVLFFRDQPISPEQHLTFGRMFGDLHIHPAAPYEHGNPELMRIHTDKDSFRNNGERWHSDVSADEEPPMASILHIKSIPTKGGDTCWSNMYAAWDGLSPQMQTLLEPLSALH
ncbi:MAG: hypothetical protein F4Y95_11770, partial [Chloroflexi bacterium]|nr:hypothetical protein [Chloroflexota bacterium]